MALGLLAFLTYAALSGGMAPSTAILFGVPTGSAMALGASMLPQDLPQPGTAFPLSKGLLWGSVGCILAGAAALIAVVWTLFFASH
jgi:hypothetical protein